MSRTFTLSGDALRWLEQGERGLSSEAIFQQMTGWPLKARGSSPLDPDDLRRCMLLLEQVPEFAPRMSEMATVSKEWAGLVAGWNSLVATLKREMASGHKAPETYAAMKKARGEEHMGRVRVVWK